MRAAFIAFFMASFLIGCSDTGSAQADEPEAYKLLDFQLGMTLSAWRKVTLPSWKDENNLFHVCSGDPESDLFDQPLPPNAGVKFCAIYYGSPNIEEIVIGPIWAAPYFLFIRSDADEEPRLMSIVYESKSASYERLKAVYLERFGNPYRIVQKPVQNRFGAVFENEVLEFRNAVSTIEIQQRDRNIDQLSVTYTHLPLQNIFDKRMADQTKAVSGRL